MTPATFRFLILLEVACLFATVLANALFLGEAFSPRLQSAYDAEPTTLAALPPGLLDSVLIVLFFLAAAATIGLWLFKRWARALNLWLTVLLLPLTILSGPTLASPWENLFGYLSAVLFGVVLAAAYFSPLSVRFDASTEAN